MARILIVEDDLTMRAIYAAGLKKAGHETRELDNGTGIADVVSDFEADAVVTDIVMAEVEGIEIVLSLRKQFPDLPVIAISGEGLYLQSAAKLGASAVVQKRFAVSDLLAAVESQLAA